MSTTTWYLSCHCLALHEMLEVSLSNSVIVCRWQDCIQAALLGMVDEAQKLVIGRLERGTAQVRSIVYRASCGTVGPK